MAGGQIYGPPAPGQIFSADGKSFVKEPGLLPNLPSITGGAAGPSGAAVGDTSYGTVTMGGGFGFWGFVGLTVVASVALIAFMRKK